MADVNSRKRQRPIVSCLRCRSKKLKCDRHEPCVNCVKAFTANTCVYNRDGHIPPTHSVPSNTGALAHSLGDLQSRMEKVEQLLGIESMPPASATEKATNPQMLGTVIVKGDRSIFHGQNDRNTLLNEFVDVKDFINHMSRDEQIQTAAKQVKFLQNKAITNNVSQKNAQKPDFLALLKLQEFLPPKSYCDRLIALYFDVFERTLRVLHIPTFMRHYEQLWVNPDLEAYQLTSILPKLTAVMTMAYHIDNITEHGDDQVHRSYLEGAAIELIQEWLGELGRRQRTELSTLQVEVLLLLSRKLRGMHPEKLWSSTGALVRSAMVMGLNVNPSMVQSYTPYQAEMRRRLWGTILEIDLQSSMTTGMPTVLPELDPASFALSNLDDLDFDESSANLPTPHPDGIYTDSIYQIILSSSLPLRLKGLSIVQCSALDIKEAIGISKKLEKCIDQLPEMISIHNSKDPPRDDGSLLHKVCTDLYLRRPLLCLYKSLLQQDDSPFYTDIQKRCLDSSLAILSYQHLCSCTSGTVTKNPMAHNNFFNECCKLDILWAALTCCQQIKVLRQVPNQSHSIHENGHSVPSLIQTVEGTIEYLINRIGEEGSDLKDIVFLVLALQSVRFPDVELGRSDTLHARTKPQTLQNSVIRTLTACRKRLLQPIVTEHVQDTLPSKRLRTSSSKRGAVATMNSMRTPTSDIGLPSTPMSDISYPVNLPEDAEQWFENLPDLAVGCTNFQTDTFNSNDFLNFGIAQEWNWDRLWQ